MLFHFGVIITATKLEPTKVDLILSLNISTFEKGFQMQCQISQCASLIKTLPSETFSYSCVLSKTKIKYKYELVVFGLWVPVQLLIVHQ